MAKDKLFISYRREDTATISGRVYDWLTQRIPKTEVFLDVDLEYGVDIMERIQETIMQCKAIVVMIGPHWLTAGSGPSAYVTKEIELALSNGVRVMPVLVGDTTMPAAEHLPPSIRAIPEINAARVRDGRDFQRDMDDLARALGITTDVRFVAPKLQERRWFQLIILLAALAAIILTVYQFSQPPPPPLPYTYGPTVPGPGCDRLGARWVLAQGDPTCLPTQAQPERLHLSVPVGQGVGQVFFYGTKQLPRNYMVSVDIDGLKAGACAGVITRNSDRRPGGYVFEVCQNGDWVIGRYDATGNGGGEHMSNLLTGRVDPQPAYRLATVTDGVSLRLKVNNNADQAAADGQYSDSDSVSLFVTPLATEESAASFQNFAFTEVKG